MYYTLYQRKSKSSTAIWGVEDRLLEEIPKHNIHGRIRKLYNQLFKFTIMR